MLVKNILTEYNSNYNVVTNVLQLFRENIAGKTESGWPFKCIGEIIGVVQHVINENLKTSMSLVTQ